MFIKREKGPAYVALPDGTILFRSELPSPNTTRWVARRKAIVVRAVAVGMLSKDEACDMYGLSDEEFDSWLAAMANHGKSGLRVTKLQEYRQL